VLPEKDKINRQQIGPIFGGRRRFIGDLTNFPSAKLAKHCENRLRFDEITIPDLGGRFLWDMMMMCNDLMCT